MKLSDIAKMSGVSVSTVSKVMHGSDEISEKTKDAVTKAAKELGCFEKYSKKKYEKKVIAVIIPEIRSEYYSSIAAMMSDCIKKAGMEVIFAESNFSGSKCVEIADFFSFRSMADGIIMFSDRETGKKLNIPSVIICDEENPQCICVNIKNAVFDAIEYLKNNGHRNIAFIGEALTQSKLCLFKEAMNKFALPVYNDYIHISNGRFYDAGKEGAKSFLSLKTRPTAVVAAYDYIAMGAIDFFGSCGVCVPRDISVIGMDDISAASAAGLTSVRTDYNFLCSEAVDLLIKRIENKYYCPRRCICINGELVIRSSVREFCI